MSLPSRLSSFTVNEYVREVGCPTDMLGKIAVIYPTSLLNTTVDPPTIFDIVKEDSSKVLM